MLQLDTRAAELKVDGCTLTGKSAPRVLSEAFPAGIPVGLGMAVDVDLCTPVKRWTAHSATM